MIRQSSHRFATVARSPRVLRAVEEHLPRRGECEHPPALLEHGHLIQTGPAEDVIDHYLTEILSIDPAELGIHRRGLLRAARIAVVPANVVVSSRVAVTL